MLSAGAWVDGCCILPEGPCILVEGSGYTFCLYWIHLYFALMLFIIGIVWHRLCFIFAFVSSMELFIGGRCILVEGRCFLAEGPCILA